MSLPVLHAPTLASASVPAALPCACLRATANVSWATCLRPNLGCQLQDQQAYIQGYLKQFEGMLFGPGFADPAAGWRQLANESNALNYFCFEVGLCLMLQWNSRCVQAVLQKGAARQLHCASAGMAGRAPGRRA